nr:MAG: hypothetical protein [Bacteriophage sp.]
MATYVPDISLTSDELVYQLINNDNGTYYDAAHLTLGTPSVNTTDYLDKNTRITVSHPKYGTIDGALLYYNRMNIQQVFDNTFPLFVCLNGENDANALGPYFQSVYGVGLQAVDITPMTISGTANTELTFTISDSSLAWYGQTPMMVLSKSKYFYGTPDTLGYYVLSDGSLLTA